MHNSYAFIFLRGSVSKKCGFNDRKFCKFLSGILFAMIEDKIVEEIAKNNLEYLRALNKKVLTSTNFNISEKIFSKTMKESIGSNSLALTHVAAFFDALECYMYIEQNTDFDFSTKSSNSKTAVHFCCAGGNSEVLSYIIDEANQPGNEDKKKKLQDIFESDYDPNIKMNLLDIAAFANSNEVIEILLENGYGINSKGQDLRSNLVLKPIATCIKRKNGEILRTLIKYMKGASGDESPLMIAISSKINDAVRILIDTETNLNYMTSKKVTALSTACSIGNEEAVEMLCSRMSDIDIPESEKAPAAAHWMCASGNINIMKIMLAHQPNLNRLNQFDKTCVSYIPTSKSDEIIINMLELLKENGFDINNKTNPPISYFLTAINMRVKVIDWLLMNGVDVDVIVKRQDSRPPKTARKIIIEKGRMKEFKELIEKYKLNEQ